jgi:hypothetical protein
MDIKMRLCHIKKLFIARVDFYWLSDSVQQHNCNDVIDGTDNIFCIQKLNILWDTIIDYFGRKFQNN